MLHSYIPINREFYPIKIFLQNKEKIILRDLGPLLGNDHKANN